MLTIYYDQILFLIFQCVVVAFLLLTLFRLRTIFGLSLLLTALGVFQYMQVFLANSLYFEIIEGVYVSSGSSVLFTGSLFAILLVYIKEDALEARKVIYAILSANIVLIILQAVINLGFEGEHVLNIYNLPKELFSQSFRISAIGTALLFLDTFLIIFAYELISKYTKSIFLRILIASIFILSIDSIAFAIFGFYGTDQVQRILVSGLISKNITALIYAVIFTIYLKYNEKGGILINSQENAYKDIFHTLTFRQKYEEIYAKNLEQDIALKESEQKYKFFVEQTSEGFFKMECEKPISINLPIAKQIELMYQYLYIKECNDTFAQMRGYKNSQELIGAKLKQLQGEKNKEINVAALSKFIENNYKTIDLKTIGLDINNKERHFLNNTVGIVENGKLISFWGTQRDLTDKIKIENLLAEANTIVNRSSSVAFLWKNDTNWPIEFVSENILNLCGYKKDEFTDGKINFIDLIHPDDIVFVQQEVKTASENSAIQNFSHKPYRIISKNNEIKWVQDNTYIRRNPEGIITHYEGIVFDITDKINAEHTLIFEKNRTQNYLDVAGVMLVSIDTEEIVQMINPKGCEILGYTEAEILGKNWFDNFLPKKHLNKIKEVSNLVYNGEIEQVKYFENEILTKDGEERLIAWTNVLILDDKGNISSTLSSGEDITERKKLETALLNEKSQLKAIIDNIPVMITLNDPNINTLFLNNEFEKKLGFTSKEAAEINIMEALYPDKEIRKQATEFYGKSLKEWKELQITSKSGEQLITEWTNVKLNNGIIIDIGLDITEKKKTTEELNKTRDILLNTLENMTDGFLTLDTNFNYLYLNNKAGELIGRDPNSLKNKNMLKEFPNGKDQPFYKYYFNAIETQKPVIFEDYYPPWDKWFENRIIPSKDGLAIFFQDITDRKKSEKALIEFNNRLQLLNKVDSTILNSKDLNFITEDILLELQKTIKYKRASLGEYISENNTFKITSVIAEDKTSKPLITIVEVSKFNFLELDKLKSGEHQIIKDLSTLNISSPILTHLISIGITTVLFVPLISDKELIGILTLYYDSKEFLTLENIEISKEIANQLAIAVNQNRLRNEILKYTEDLEEKIAERTEQLEFTNRELRDFAQIVSHDLKAPLRAISQLSYWVSQDYADKIDDAGKEQLAMLIGRVKRMDNLIEGILQYSKAGKIREKEILIDLNSIVNEVIISLNPSKNIEIKIDNKLPKILGDPTRFSQVFQNLISNAIKFNDKSKGIIILGSSKKDDLWEFYVSDNGPGIEEKYFDRIFQIFQRLETRDNQEGTGVGLSLVKRIIQIYGGDIWLNSKINEGTTFYFTLPIKI